VTGPRWWCSGRCPPPENPARFRGGVRGAGGTVPSPRASGDRPTPAPGERIFADPECTPASAWCSMAVRTPAGQRAFRGWVIEHQAVIGPRKMRGNPYTGRGTTGLGPPSRCARDRPTPHLRRRRGARRAGGRVARVAGPDRARRTPGWVRWCSWSWSPYRANAGPQPGTRGCRGPPPGVECGDRQVLWLCPGTGLGIWGRVRPGRRQAAGRPRSDADSPRRTRDSHSPGRIPESCGFQRPAWLRVVGLGVGALGGPCSPVPLVSRFVSGSRSITAG
jgi:hypothetical protein